MKNESNANATHSLEILSIFHIKWSILVQLTKRQSVFVIFPCLQIMPISLRKGADNKVKHVLASRDNGYTIAISYSITIACLERQLTLRKALCYLGDVDKIVVAPKCLLYGLLPALRLQCWLTLTCIVTLPKFIVSLI